MSKTVKLGEVATFINGYPFKPSDWGAVGLPIIRIQNLTRSSNEVNYYSGEYPERVEVNDGDVLISWSASLGVHVWQDGKAVLNQHIFKVNFDKCDIDKMYFVYAVTQKIEEMVGKTHGSTMKHIIKGDFEKTRIPLPTITEQRKIAAVLDVASGLIAERKHQLEQLDLLVKSRLVEMFGDPESNPMGWDKSTIGDSCHYVKDGPHVSPKYVEDDTGVPFISTRNLVGRNGIDWSTAKYISENDYEMYIKKCNPQKGDILYTKGGTTGIACYVDTDIRFANWVHVAVLKFGGQLNGVYFEHMLNSDYCYRQSQILTKGIANRDLVLSAMKQIAFYLPPLPLQEKFADFVRQVDKSKFEIQQGLEKLELQYNALMQKYFG